MNMPSLQSYQNNMTPTKAVETGLKQEDKLESPYPLQFARFQHIINKR